MGLEDGLAEPAGPAVHGQPQPPVDLRLLELEKMVATPECAELDTPIQLQRSAEPATVWPGPGQRPRKGLSARMPAGRDGPIQPRHDPGGAALVLEDRRVPVEGTRENATADVTADRRRQEDGACGHDRADTHLLR